MTKQNDARPTRSGNDRSHRRWVAYLLGLGLLGAGAALYGGNWPAAVAAVVVFGAWAFVAWRFPDRDAVHDVLMPPGDERDTRLHERSAATAFYLLVPVLVVGFFVELLRGEPGAFTAMAALAGVLNIGAQVWLRRRT